MIHKQPVQCQFQEYDYARVLVMAPARLLCKYISYWFLPHLQPEMGKDRRQRRIIEAIWLTAKVIKIKMHLHGKWVTWGKRGRFNICEIIDSSLRNEAWAWLVQYFLAIQIITLKCSISGLALHSIDLITIHECDWLHDMSARLNCQSENRFNCFTEYPNEKGIDICISWILKYL